MTKHSNASTQHMLPPMLTSFQRSLTADQYLQPTIDHYVGAAQQYYEATGDVLPTRDGVRDWLIALRDSGAAAASINNRWRGLRAYCKWLKKEQEVEVDPMSGMAPPPLDETAKDVATPKEVADVLRFLEKAKRWRDYALIAILYDTGVRASELADARMEHLDMASGALFIKHAKGRRVRYVKLSPQAIKAVDRIHRHTDSPYVVYGQKGALTRSGVYQLVRKAFADAKVTRAVFGPHDLRHTSASHVAESRLLSESEAMQLYGWKSAAMWRRYTEQVRTAAAMKAHEQASPLTRLLAKDKGKH